MNTFVIRFSDSDKNIVVLELQALDLTDAIFKVFTELHSGRDFGTHTNIKLFDSVTLELKQ